jgi:hypothetical protein
MTMNVDNHRIDIYFAREGSRASRQSLVAHMLRKN